MFFLPPVCQIHPKRATRNGPPGRDGVAECPADFALDAECRITSTSIIKATKDSKHIRRGNLGYRLSPYPRENIIDHSRQGLDVLCGLYCEQASYSRCYTQKNSGCRWTMSPTTGEKKARNLDNYWVSGLLCTTLDCCLVPRKGLEPPHLAAAGPKPAASTNFATWACTYP